MFQFLIMSKEKSERRDVSVRCPGYTQGGPGCVCSGLLKTHIWSHINSSEVAHSASHRAICSLTGISLSGHEHRTCLGCRYMLNLGVSCRTLIDKKLVRNNEQDQMEMKGTAVRGSVLLTSRGSSLAGKLLSQGGQAHNSVCGSTVARKNKNAAFLGGCTAQCVAELGK